MEFYFILNISDLANSEITVESGNSSIQQEEEENSYMNSDTKNPSTTPKSTGMEEKSTQTITNTTHIDASMDESSTESGALCK